jgi:hypothetical protein
MGEGVAPFPSREGARKSEAEGAHDLALCAGVGAGVAQDWSAALDHLQRARNSSCRLQAELAALAGDWPLSKEVADGKAASFTVGEPSAQDRLCLARGAPPQCLGDPAAPPWRKASRRLRCATG